MLPGFPRLHNSLYTIGLGLKTLIEHFWVNSYSYFSFFFLSAQTGCFSKKYWEHIKLILWWYVLGLIVRYYKKTKYQIYMLLLS